jgi:hypothetical protein
MKKRAIGGLVLGLVLVPLACAWGEPPYRHMPMHSVAYGGDACCPDPCAPRCCIGLIPAVLHGVDKVLSHIFCGRCYDPCCAPVAGHVSGCSDCSDPGYPMMPGEMVSRRTPVGPMGTTRAQQAWDIPRGSAHRVTRTPGKPAPGRSIVADHSVMKPKLAEAPQARPAVKAQPASSRPAVAAVAEAELVEPARNRDAGQVRRTSFQQVPEPNLLPSNPLR